MCNTNIQETRLNGGSIESTTLISNWSHSYYKLNLNKSSVDCGHFYFSTQRMQSRVDVSVHLLFVFVFVAVETSTDYNN